MTVEEINDTIATSKSDMTFDSSDFCLQERKCKDSNLPLKLDQKKKKSTSGWLFSYTGIKGSDFATTKSATLKNFSLIYYNSDKIARILQFRMKRTVNMMLC